MNRPFISAYTPSNTDAKILEEMFVQREILLTQMVRKLEHSMLTPDKHHILLIGPRGSGKTHLLTLAHHRLVDLAQNNAALQNNMRVAWLAEDATFTHLVDIALAMAQTLSQAYPLEFHRHYRQLAQGKQGDDAARIILEALIEDLGDKYILLITENLDRSLNQLGDMGQKSWRAFMQEHPRISILASAQQRVGAVSDRDLPFFGFFGLEYLSPLSVEQARELTTKMAKIQKNQSLEQYLQNPEAFNRIQALHYLAGGNHRIYVLLSEMLSKDHLDNLVSAFESLADEMTPYFQERLRSLPSQQAKIVEHLCGLPGAANVKSIAQDLFIDERSCAKQLGELKNKAYVQTSKQGKESYYEMSEPLMRLCLDVKHQRGKPLPLVTQFIRAWFSDHDLQLQMLSVRNDRTLEYCQAALNIDMLSVYRKIYPSLTADPILSEIDTLIENSDWQQIIDKFNALNGKRPQSMGVETWNKHIPWFLYIRGLSYFKLESFDSAVLFFSEAINYKGLASKFIISTKFYRALSYCKLGSLENAQRDLDEILNDPELDDSLRYEVLWSLGAIKMESKEFNEAVDYFDKALSLALMDTTKPSVNIWSSLSYCHMMLKNHELALKYCNLMLSQSIGQLQEIGVYTDALVVRAFCHDKLGNLAAAQADWQCVIDDQATPKNATIEAHFNLAYLRIGSASLADITQALQSAFVFASQQGEFFDCHFNVGLFKILQLGSRQWAEYLNALLPILAKHQQWGAMEKSLLQSIALMAEMDLSHSQLDAWLAAWQQFYDRHQDKSNLKQLHFSIEILAACIDSIKSKSEKPFLKALPLEIRRLIAPMIQHHW